MLRHLLLRSSRLCSFPLKPGRAVEYRVLDFVETKPSQDVSPCPAYMTGIRCCQRRKNSNLKWKYCQLSKL